MPTPRLTQGDLRKALLPVPRGLHGESLLDERFCGVSAASGAVCRSEVRVLVTRFHCGEEDPRPGLREAGPHHLLSPAPISVLVCRMTTSRSSL